MMYRRRAALLLAAAVTLGQGGPARAGNTDYLKPFRDFGIRQHDADGKRSTAVYTSTGNDPDWFVSQFDLAGGSLSTFAANSGALTATAPGATVTVSRAGARPAVTLQQRGFPVPCLSDAGRPRESDLFLSGKTVPAYAKDGPSLASLRSLQLAGTVKVDWGPSAQNKGCAVSKAAAVVDITLINRASPDRQVLFYQLSLAAYCQAPTVCGRSSGLQFFYRKNPFGVNDTADALGRPMLQNHQSSTFALDVLPRLTQAIASGPPEMDRDLSHWTLSGGYLGSISWGDVDVSTTWSDYRVVLGSAS